MLTMTDVTTTVDSYFAMWNEADPDERARDIVQAWADDGRYVDPLLEATGHAELSAMVEGVHAQFPGHRFRRTSGIDVHHEEVRFAWELAAPDGTLTVAGLDFGALGPDGRLQRISGFFGDLPAA
jgi:hypothetical protein